MFTLERIRSRKLFSNQTFAIFVIFLLGKIESKFDIFLGVVLRVISYLTIVNNPDFIRNGFGLFIIRSSNNYQPIFLVLFQFLPKYSLESIVKSHGWIIQYHNFRVSNKGTS